MDEKTEELRAQLGELNRRLIVLMGNIEDMEKCIAVIRKEATELYMEIDTKLNGNEGSKKMGMQSLLLKGLYYLAFKLILSWLVSDEDSAEVEEALVNAKNEDEVKEVAKRVLIETIDEHFMKETDIPDSVVDGLVKATNTSEVVAVLETETGQKTFFEGLGDIVTGILSLVWSSVRKGNRGSKVQGSK